MPLSEAFIAATNAQQTAMVVCEIIVIDHDSLAAPLRFCTNGESIVVAGNTYTAIGCEVSLPNDQEEGIASATLVLDNTLQQLTPLLRSVTGEISITISQVRLLNGAASPPTFQVEIPFLPFTLTEAEITDSSARLSLTYNNGLNTEFPADDFNPTDFPGAF